MSETTDEYAGEFGLDDVEFTRKGDWYFVRLGGQLVKRKFSRTGAITGVQVHFYNNRSPRFPRTESKFCRVEWLTGEVHRAIGPQQWRDRGNYLQIPLQKAGH